MGSELRVAYLAIGDEVVGGRVCDSNADLLRGTLSELGQFLTYVAQCPDRQDQIVSALGHLAQSGFQRIVVSGGLGPTRDDLTRAAVAEFAGVPLEWSEEAWSNVTEAFQRLGRSEIPEVNRVQAQVPSGAQVLRNDRGTACGLCVRVAAHSEIQVFCLPGVPHEFRGLLERYVKPSFGEPLFREGQTSEWLLHGLGESAFETQFFKAVPFESLASYAICARHGLFLEISLRGETKAAHQKAVEALESQFGPHVLCPTLKPLPDSVISQARTQGLSLASVESCTGGNIAYELTSVSGSSEVFLGGTVAYSREVKADFTSCALSSFAGEKVYSAETAARLAASAQKVFGADVSLSTTGVAGPGNSDEGVKEGTLFVGLAGAQKHREAAGEFFSSALVPVPASLGGDVDVFRFSLRSLGDRAEMRKRMTSLALAVLCRALMLALVLGLVAGWDSWRKGNAPQAVAQEPDAAEEWGEWGSPASEGASTGVEESESSRFLPSFRFGLVEERVPSAPPVAGTLNQWSYLLAMRLSYVAVTTESQQWTPFFQAWFSYPTRIRLGIGRPLSELGGGFGVRTQFFPHYLTLSGGSQNSRGELLAELEFDLGNLQFARHRLLSLQPLFSLGYAAEHTFSTGAQQPPLLRVELLAQHTAPLGRFWSEEENPLDRSDSAFQDSSAPSWSSAGTLRTWGGSLRVLFQWGSSAAGQSVQEWGLSAFYREVFFNNLVNGLHAEPLTSLRQSLGWVVSWSRAFRPEES